MKIKFKTIEELKNDENILVDTHYYAIVKRNIDGKNDYRFSTIILFSDGTASCSGVVLEELFTYYILEKDERDIIEITTTPFELNDWSNDLQSLLQKKG